jgi:ABC-type branched-subunit amino acid transport system substrate-binding protein
MLAAVGAAVALLAAACGSSSKNASSTATTVSSTATTVSAASGSSSTAAASSGSARGFNGTTLTVSGFGDEHDFAGADSGAIAYFDALNASGGIDGIKINYVGFSNDNLDPSTALSQARLLVTSEHVFAVVPDLSPVNPVAYWTQEQVPYVGWGFDQSYCSPTPSTSLWGFGYNGCAVNPKATFVGDKYASLYKYMVSVTGSQHPTLLSFTEDTASGQAGEKQAKTAAEGTGFTVIEGQNLPTNATDFTPYIQSWLTAANGKPPDVIDCESGIQCVSVYTQLRAAGYKGVYHSYNYAPALMKTLAGSVVGVLYNVLPNAGLTQMNKDLQTYQPKAQFTSGVAAAYFSAAMFAEAAKTVVDQQGKSALTPAAVQKVLSHINFQIPGLVGPVDYPPSTVSPVPFCQGLLMDTPTKYVSLEPYTCPTKTYPVS